MVDLLNSHPEVFVSNEVRIFTWAHHALKSLPSDERFLVSHRERFIEHLKGVLRAEIPSFYQTLAPHAQHWGDKNPHYSDPRDAGCLDTIRELFPSARFVHLIRDGRDVAASLLQQRNEDGRPWVDFAQAHWTWRAHLDVGLAFGASLPSAQYAELRYEELVKSDEEVSRRLFSHLGIVYHDKVTRYCAEQQIRRTPLSSPSRDLAVGTLVSRWSTAFTPEQQLLSLDIIASHLVSLGYATQEWVNRTRERLSTR